MMTTTFKASKNRHRAGTLVWVAVALFGVLIVYLIQREQTVVLKQRHENAILAYTFDKTNAAVLTLDKEGKIFSATSGVYGLTGYTAEELVGLSPEKLMPVAYREAHRVGYAKAMAGTEPTQHQIFCHIRKKDGENIVVLNHVFGYEGGGVAVISPAPQSAALTKLYQMGLEAANVGIWWWEVDADRLIWDKAMFKIFGVSEDKWTPSYAGFDVWVHPDDRPWLNELVTQCLATGQAYRAVFRVNRPDGTLVHVRTYGRIFNDDPQRVFAGVNILVPEDEYTGEGELISH